MLAVGRAKSDSDRHFNAVVRSFRGFARCGFWVEGSLRVGEVEWGAFWGRGDGSEGSCD